jgi:hypothetical protein
MAELEKGNEPDPRKIQINLTGFLERNTSAFMAELWKLLISAQDNYQPGQKGMPSQLLKEKEEEIKRINQELQERARKISEDQQRFKEVKDSQDRSREVLCALHSHLEPRCLTFFHALSSLPHSGSGSYRVSRPLVMGMMVFAQLFDPARKLDVLLSSSACPLACLFPRFAVPLAPNLLRSHPIL